MTELLPDAVLRYAEHEDGVIDLHLPATRATGPTPVLLLIHGGFWKTAYDRRHTRPMARALARAGFVVASPEYRRVGPGGSGGWPTTADDVRRAADALPTLLPDLGIEPGPLVVTGHSAGGHLALWLAATAADSGLVIERTVALAPVSDLREAAARSLGTGATEALMGGGPDGVDYDPADPKSLFARLAQADVTIVHGTDDGNVPIALSRGFVERHPWVRLREVRGGHFEPIQPGTTAWTVVVSALAHGVGGGT